jgi:hypothetical protein
LRHGREDDAEPLPIHAARHPLCLHQERRRSKLLLKVS